MLTYDLKVGYSCNNKCKHCVIDDSKDKLIEKKQCVDLTTEECLEQIQDALEHGIKNIVLTGGEITIRKDFTVLLNECVRNDLNITIQTNGRKLHDKEILDTVRNIVKIRFVVALHGDCATVHDNITQVKGSFDETCKGIKAMCDLGKLVVIKVVISKINAEKLCGITRLASELGAKYICFAFPHGQGAARKNFSEIIPRYSELKPVFNNLIELSYQLNVNIEFEAVPFCIIPENMKFVGELKYFYGETLCTQVKEDTFNWDEIRKSIKSKGKICKNCDISKFCEGVWCEYSETFGTEELKPIQFPPDKKDKIIKSMEYFLTKR